MLDLALPHVGILHFTDRTPEVAGSSWQLREGAWAPHGLRTLNETLVVAMRHQINVAVDGGANSGVYAIALAKLPFVTRVFAFEPVPKLVNLLKENLALNQVQGKVEVFAQALHEKSGTLTFKVAEDAAFSHAGSRMLRKREGKPFKFEEISVSATTLDDSLRTIPGSHVVPAGPMLIKLDLEGAELFALKGAANTLRERKPILLYELEDRNTQQHGYRAAEIEPYLRSLGYQHFTPSVTGDMWARAE